MEFASAHRRGIKIVIAGAGGAVSPARHGGLGDPRLPVIGVPVNSTNSSTAGTPALHRPDALRRARRHRRGQRRAQGHSRRPDARPVRRPHRRARHADEERHARRGQGEGQGPRNRRLGRLRQEEARTARFPVGAAAAGKILSGTHELRKIFYEEGLEGWKRRLDVRAGTAGPGTCSHDSPCSNLPAPNSLTSVSSTLHTRDRT
ncbi:MAG: hypothetical protein U1F87_01265 [Kiritimatiellia bacterium]